VASTGNEPKSAIPDGWRGEPLLVIFFITSPSPVALPHGATFNFERGETVEWLADATRVATKDLPPLPIADRTKSFVSIRIWRPKEKLILDTGSLNYALKVARAVVPGLSGDELPPLTYDNEESGSTVFELVTPLLLSTDPSADAQGALSDAFDRCLENLTELIRAYIIKASDVRTTVPSLVSLFPYVPFTARAPDGSWWGALELFRVSMGTRHLPLATGDLTKEQVTGMMTSLSRMKRRDPTAVFALWARAATRSHWIDGDYSSTIIQAHISSEVLLDSLLLLLAWEERVEPSVAAEWFDHQLAKRVRTYYHPRLAGSWDTTQTKSPVGRWSEFVRLPRNRIVHSGIWPSRAEGFAALEANHALEQFLKARVGVARNKYPRTALILLGTPGLAKRGLLKGRIKKFMDDTADTEPDWFDSFAKWTDLFETERKSR
jgi:hypothetical protein